MKVAITGHRPDKLGGDYDLTSPLIGRIKLEIYDVLHGKNIECLITGMALGIDTLFAKMAIDYLIPFTAALPCKNQQSKWPERSCFIYNQIINHPLCTIKYVSEKPYHAGCMQKRNEWMVNNSDLLIAVWDGSAGGTKNCIDYAIKNKKDIVYINLKLDVSPKD